MSDLSIFHELEISRFPKAEAETRENENIMETNFSQENIQIYNIR